MSDLRRANLRSRRNFLAAGASLSALSLFPWLRQGAAQLDQPPRRLLLVYTPHGTVWDRWRPTGGETDFEFSPILKPLESHRSRLVIIDGLQMESGTEYYIPHTYTMPVLWTGDPIDTSDQSFCREDHNQCFGWNTGTSIDQALAQRLSPATPYPTLELGYGCGQGHPANRMIYASAGTPKSPLDDPTRAFETLFGELDLSQVSGQQKAAHRKSVLDAVRQDFSTRRAVLSSTDKARLDAHAQSLFELERSLSTVGLSCGTLSAPMDVNAETAMDRQSDIVAASFGCGLTTIASFQLYRGDNDNSLYPWAGIDEGGHHTLSHDSGADAQSKLASLYTWYAERVSYLLDRLADTPDVDGTSVLDNTLVIWGSELGTGWTHDISNVPFVLAGGAGGLMRGGRYLKVTNSWWTQLLVSACHAMGQTDIERFGTLGASGPLDGVLT